MSPDISVLPETSVEPRPEAGLPRTQGRSEAEEMESEGAPPDPQPDPTPESPEEQS